MNTMGKITKKVDYGNTYTFSGYGNKNWGFVQQITDNDNTTYMLSQISIEFIRCEVNKFLFYKI